MVERRIFLTSFSLLKDLSALATVTGVVRRILVAPLLAGPLQLGGMEGGWYAAACPPKSPSLYVVLAKTNLSYLNRSKNFCDWGRPPGPPLNTPMVRVVVQVRVLSASTCLLLTHCTFRNSAVRILPVVSGWTVRHELLIHRPYMCTLSNTTW